MKIRKYFFIEMLSLPISSLKLGKNKMAASIIFRPDKGSQLLITTRFCGYLALIWYQFKFDTNVQICFDFTSFFLQVHQDQLLSVSQDKTIRLTNISSKSEIQRFHCESEVWACCWNTDNPFLFYVGKYLKNHTMFL